MAITSLDGLIAANSQRLTYLKTASRTSVAAIPFSVFDLAGNPSAGSLTQGNTTNGVVPTHLTNGYPRFTSFGGNTGYLSGVQFGSSVACRMTIFDCLFTAGSYTFNTPVTLLAQPSYASRVLGGTDFTNTEIWIEAVTAFTGNLSVAVTYTNQDGVAGRTTGTYATGAALIVGRMAMLPLQAGDTGVQKIESVTPSVATAGTFNVHVMRRLWQGRVRINNDGDAHDFTKTGMPQIFDNSALRFVIQSDSTATGIPEFQLEIVNG
jgi:hypothetical protein